MTSLWNFGADTVTGNMTLYAKQLFKITFDSLDGSAVPPLYGESGKLVVAPSEPVRAGCTFDGWYKEAELINLWDFEVDTVTGATTLYAKWEALPGTEGLEYTLFNDDSEYRVTGYTGSSAEVFIPLFYNGLPVTSIGDYAFSGNADIESLIIYGITEIGSNAFAECEKLMSVSLCEGLLYIYSDAFIYCTVLLSVIIPSSVIYIGNDAFYDDSGKTITLYFEAPSEPAGWPQWWKPTASFIIWGTDGVEKIYSFETYGGTAVAPVTGFNLPTMPIVEKEGYYFNGWYENAEFSGEAVVFPYFSKTALTLYVKWLPEQPGGPTTEGLIFELFANNTKYRVAGYTGTSTTVFIPSIYNGLPVTEIKYSTFANNNYITSVTIGNGINIIGSNAFSNCTLLETVVIGSSVNSIGQSAFDGCAKLKSIVIPEGVTEIKDSAFNDCASLTSVVIPNSVTSIQNNAFYRCPLLSVVIPYGVTYIGYAAFYSTGLVSVTVEAETPPTLYIYNPLVFFVSGSLQIFVPQVSLEAYKTAQGWSELADYIFAIAE